MSLTTKADPGPAARHTAIGHAAAFAASAMKLLLRAIDARASVVTGSRSKA